MLQILHSLVSFYFRVTQIILILISIALYTWPKTISAIALMLAS